MKRMLVGFLCVSVLLVGCTTWQQGKKQTRITKEYLNGTWYIIPINEYKGLLAIEKYSWGYGVVGGQFFLRIDIDRNIAEMSDGLRFIDSIKIHGDSNFEIGLNYPLDHKPTEEEIAAHKAAGPDEVIVVHFVNKDQIWIDLQKGFNLDKTFDPQKNIYYRYSGPGTSVQDKE